MTETLKTPAEWCRIEGVEILDPDGWRGSNGRPWTDPISLAEFRDRLICCTQRAKWADPQGVITQPARDHRLRPENATYTAAEVKVLTAKAREEIAEEIAQALEEFARNDMRGRSDMDIDRAAAIAREIGSKDASA